MNVSYICDVEAFFVAVFADWSRPTSCVWAWCKSARQ